MALGHDRYFDLGAMRLALSLAGIAPPEVAAGCEIGRGGLSAAIAAATRPGARWRAAFADEALAAEVAALAGEAGLPLEVSAGIEAFCGRDDAPEVDFVGVTESWSILGAGAQEAILGFLARRLRPGGVLAVGCLVAPGAAQDAPLRLLGRTLLGDAAPGDADFAARFAAMLDAAAEALATAPMVQARHTDYAARIAAMRSDPDPEALWRRWFAPEARPTSFGDMAARLGAAGLEFAASAELSNHVREINFTPRQRAYLARIGDVATREQMADLISYTWGRADYWVKAPARMEGRARAAALGDLRLVAARPAAAFDHRADGLLGPVSLRREVYRPILAALDAAPAIRLADLGPDLEAAAEAAALLVSAGQARVAPAPEAAEAARAASARLNRALFAAAAGGLEAAALAAPVLGGAVEVAPRRLRLIAARAEGAADAEALARRAAEMERAAGAPAGDAAEAARFARDARDFLDEAGNYARIGVL